MCNWPNVVLEYIQYVWLVLLLQCIAVEDERNVVYKSGGREQERGGRLVYLPNSHHRRSKRESSFFYLLQLLCHRRRIERIHNQSPSFVFDHLAKYQARDKQAYPSWQ